MKITLEDDLGNVKVLGNDESKDLVICNKSVQEYFSPCMGCENIVLYGFEDNSSENGPLCVNCK